MEKIQCPAVHYHSANELGLFCLHSRSNPTHRDPTPRALEDGHCLKTSVMFFLNYFLIIELSLSQTHITVALR